MRASLPSPSPAVTSAFGAADAKSTGSPPSAAADASATATGDRGADSARGGTKEQPFSAALASAHGASEPKQGKGAGAAAANEETDRADTTQLQIEAAVLQAVRAREAATSAAASAGSASASPSASASAKSAATLTLSIADEYTLADDDTQAQAPEDQGDDSAVAVHEGGSSSKSRAGKHAQSPTVLDGAALSAIAVLLGASTAQAAPLSAAEPSAPAASASADVTSAVTAPTVAGQHPPSGGPINVAANTAPSIGPAALDSSAPGAAAATRVPSDALLSARAVGGGEAGSAIGGALISAMQSVSSATTPATTSATASIAVPVHDATWPQVLAAQVQWMATRQVQSATLRLEPEHLGPLEVRIDVTSSQINVNFTAHHADTREALAQAVPRLRELFAAGGLNLGEASVRQQPRSSEQGPRSSPSNATPTSETVERVANTTVQRIGLVDEYA